MSRRILVLDSYAHTLAVVRSLSRSGYQVTTGVDSDSADFNYVRRSRYVRSSWVHPPINDNSDRFLRALLGFLEATPDLGLIYPVGERSVRYLAKTRTRIPERVAIIMPPNEILSACLDKPTAYRIAEECGVPVPDTRTVGSAEELREAIDDLGLPSIVKALDSTHSVKGKKCIFIHDKAGIDRLADEWPEEHDRLIVQNEIRGTRYNCDIVASNGKIEDYFESEILRTDRADYSGISVLDRSMAPDPAHRRYCEQFVSRLGYTGLTLIQFLKDASTGSSYFLEANPRTGATIALSVHCGLDLPADAVRACTQKSLSASDNYPLNVRQYWLMGDLRGVRRSLKEGDIGVSQLPRELASVIGNGLRANCHRTFSWRDPKPISKIIRNDLRRMIRKL